MSGRTCYRLLIFQFPLGIRWCSDYEEAAEIYAAMIFQFPLGIRWCSDFFGGLLSNALVPVFQFPLGIRWCSDVDCTQAKEQERNFQFPLGIRWCSDTEIENGNANPSVLSIPPGN